MRRWGWLTPGHRPGVNLPWGDPVLRSHTAHRASGLYAHVTWHTYRRMKAIRKCDVPEIVASVLEAGRQTGVRVHAQAVLRDHVHVLVSYRPDTTLAAFVRDAKSESSRLAGPNATWCRGYYAGSVCENHLAYTRRYIADQHGHHPDLIPPG